MFDKKQIINFINILEIKKQFFFLKKNDISKEKLYVILFVILFIKKTNKKKILLCNNIYFLKEDRINIKKIFQKKYKDIPGCFSVINKDFKIYDRIIAILYFNNTLIKNFFFCILNILIFFKLIEFNNKILLLFYNFIISLNIK